MSDKKLFIFGLIVLSILAMMSLYVGEIKINFSAIFKILGGGESENAAWSYIIENRLNRTLVALFAGGALALAGLILQVYFNNPLAGPGVLGITSGATFGVAFVILGGASLINFIGQFGIVTAGLLGALAVLFLLVFIARYLSQLISLLVVGLMLGYFISAFTNVLFLWANAYETRAFVLWGMGSFEGLSSIETLIFCSVICCLFVLSLFIIKPLNALVMGQAYAQSVGINLKQTKFFIIIITGLLAAIVTVYCGPISFIGVAVPPLVRIIFKNKNHLFLIPAVILVGALLGLIADLVCRISHQMLPLNTITALIGAPVIIYTIVKLNKRFA